MLDKEKTFSFDLLECFMIFLIIFHLHHYRRNIFDDAKMLI